MDAMSYFQLVGFVVVNALPMWEMVVISERIGMSYSSRNISLVDGSVVCGSNVLRSEHQPKYIWK